VVRLLFIVSWAVFSAYAQATLLTDPTRPGVAKRVVDLDADSVEASAAPVREVLRLNAVQKFEKSSVAVISGKTYRVGESIKQDIITVIRFDKVIFSSGKELHLFGNSVVNISK